MAAYPNVARLFFGMSRRKAFLFAICRGRECLPRKLLEANFNLQVNRRDHPPQQITLAGKMISSIRLSCPAKQADLGQPAELIFLSIGLKPMRPMAATCSKNSDAPILNANPRRQSLCGPTRRPSPELHCVWCLERLRCFLMDTALPGTKTVSPKPEKLR